MNLKLLILATLPLFCFAANDDININYNNGVTSKTIKESPKSNIIAKKSGNDVANHILTKQEKSTKAANKKVTTKQEKNKIAKFRNKAYVEEVVKITHRQDYQVRKWLKKHPKEHIYDVKQYNFSKKDIQKLKDLDIKYKY